MARPNPAEPDPKPAEGLSQFVGKVLDQLSLSAWLPAAMLVGCGALLVQLRHQRNTDIGAALVALTAKPLGILVVLLFALVLAAMLSQAFAFGTIRVLEGYWAGPRVLAALFTALTHRQARHRQHLESRLRTLEKVAFRYAREAMLDGKVPRHIIDIHEDDVFNRGPESGATWTAEQRREAEAIGWNAYCRPEHIEKISHLARRLGEFPESHRLLPTKLGNVLRATEDRLTDDGGTEGWMLRRLESVPAGLRQRHDQFRTRLDMYCTLVFGCLLLAVLAAVLLLPSTTSPIGASAVVALFLVLAVISYSAAIASARGYCTVLSTIDRHGASARPEAPAQR